MLIRMNETFTGFDDLPDSINSADDLPFDLNSNLTIEIPDDEVPKAYLPSEDTASAANTNH